MTPITCIFVEDDKHGMELLKNYAGLNPHLDTKGFFYNPLEALKFVGENPVQLIFTDVQMPEMSGLDFIKCLRYKPYIVLITAEPSHAITGYDLDVVDFILKPVTIDRFIKAVNRVLDRKELTGISSNQIQAEEVEYSVSSIYVKENGKVIRLDFDEIIAIEGLKDYVKIITETGNVITHITMKKLEEQILPKPRFLRVHKSYFVSTNQIKKYNNLDSLLEMRNKLEIPVGAQYKEDLIEHIKPIN